MDRLDRQILNIIQTEFPLTERPFLAIAERLQTTEDDVLQRVQRLRDEGIIRQISAIFDSRRLGYRSTLIAAQVPPEKLDEVANRVSQHPGVSHNYARNHAYNLWFTLTVSSGQDPATVAAQIAEEVGVDKFLNLPALRIFKIGVNFNMEDEN